ncbi:type III restriction-modification system methylation subunit [Ectothiorhodospira sp. PHS-1]|uniref:site-specific DNA-methyltransferase n=1 Tax=Ectothiorhodospira sp. PHS-1 TaxID=519989 RepID=UPI00024A8431|nr:site-specific DNA-methyltransferase [Ectothiorhodospira sp. PHS-1]EHQ52212.1 type III restriction-modification system methylation subunit [Ectothiorhodospira sp. PHS-1]
MTEEQKINKLKMHSPDLSQDNIAKIRELFPGCVTEARDEATGKLRLAVDFDQLRQELSDHIVEGPQERYRLDWPGKREALALANTPVAKTLRPSRNESVAFDTTQNLFIEGDNLEVLKLLQETYLGQVKLIYIDPPYNTGNEFIYVDDFSTKAEEYLLQSSQADAEGNRLVANRLTNGRYHSDWLNMLYPRLKLARNLLANDGLIFISIDDHELHNLQKIGIEVFGEDNFVGLITRATGTPTGGGFDGLTNMVDYIVVFRRSPEAVLNGLEFQEEDAAIYNEEDERGRYLTRSLRRTGGEDRREDRPSMYYGVEAPDGTLVYPIGPGGYESRWICGRDRFDEMERNGLVQWKKIDRDNGPEWHPYQKFYLEGRQKRPSNLWTGVEGNKKGTRQIRECFDGEKVFDSPKPVGLLQRIVQIATNKDSLVMDFFSGSATTAHAVMLQNKTDGGCRSHIQIQLPEPTPEESAARTAGYSTIADVGKERIRRAGNTMFDGECHPDWNRDVGFRVLKVDTSNMKDVFYRPDEMKQSDLLDMVDNVKEDRTAEDLLFQVLVDWGVDLTLPIRRETVQGKTVFFVDDNALVACFETGVTEELVKELAKREPLRVVFRDNGFVSDAVKINVEQIFRQLSPTTEVKSL